jgi:hypothetical protein
MSASPYPVPDGSLVMLWSGEDPVLYDCLLEQLESRGIRFSSKSLGDDEVAPTADPLPIDAKPRFGFEVAVMSPDLPVAREILDKLLNEEPADVELPADDSVRPEVLRAPHAEDEALNVEVWCGTDARLAVFMIEALQENEIPSHTENALGQTRIFVTPSSEARAREIVREIREGTPPL